MQHDHRGITPLKYPYSTHDECPLCEQRLTGQGWYTGLLFSLGMLSMILIGLLGDWRTASDVPLGVMPAVGIVLVLGWCLYRVFPSILRGLQFLFWLGVSALMLALIGAVALGNSPGVAWS